MENMNLSDKSKEALREEIVKEYLMAGYKDENKQHDIEVSGTAYKVLERGEITTFYDGFGNTLFNVENKELAAKYDELFNGGNERGPVDENEAVADDEADNDTISLNESKELPAPAVADPQKEDGRPAKLVAKEKLEKELKGEKDKSFAEPIIGYLLKRCEEDEGLAEDVAQEHKTWQKCFDYIYSQARKEAKGNCVAVRDEVVYEWAEDYYHKDDTAEEEKKAKEAAERKEKEEERRKKAVEQKKTDKKNPKQVAKKEDKAEEKPAELPKTKKNPRELDGQLDLFSMMGM